MTYVIGVSGFNGHTVNKKFDKLFPARDGQQRPMINERMRKRLEELKAGDTLTKAKQKHGGRVKNSGGRGRAGGG
jgi:hypothetical protein